jgi:serine/threonine protein kinase
MDPRARLPAGYLLAGDYRIDSELGAGGFGITYKAIDAKLGVAVAIKEYFPAAFGGRESRSKRVGPLTAGHHELFDWGRKRFLDEASNLARLKHANIVGILRFFEANDTAYIVLAYEPGLSLGAWLEELGRPPSQSELDRIVMPLLDALALLHRTGLMHRDLSPDNIIIREDGSPVLPCAARFRGRAACPGRAHAIDDRNRQGRLLAARAVQPGPDRAGRLVRHLRDRRHTLFRHHR